MIQHLRRLRGLNGEVFGVLAALWLVGCAHEPAQPKPDYRAAQQKVLDDLMGKDINDAIGSYGPPTSTYAMPNGDVLYTYDYSKTVPGYTAPIFIKCTLTLQAHASTIVRAGLQGC